MWLDKFGQYVLRNRANAIILALVFSVLPFLTWISAVIVGLVTLCISVYDGFIVLIWIALPYVVLSVVQHTWVVLPTSVVLSALLVWLSAIVLRRTGHWAFALEGLALIGIVVVLVLHVAIPHISQFWSTEAAKLMGKVFAELPKGVVTSKAQLTEMHAMLDVMAQYATGLLGVYMLFAAIVELVFARMIHARLTKLSSFRSDWLRFRLHRVAAMLILVFALLAWFGPTLFRDVLPIVALPGIIAGISVFHAWLCRKKPIGLWMFYLVLVFGAMILPVFLFFVLALTIVGILDSAFHFKKVGE